MTRCKLCGNLGENIANLCSYCSSVNHYVRLNPDIAIKVLRQMGRLPSPSVINNTVELDGYEYEDTIIYSIALPEGEASLMVPAKPLNDTSYRLLCRWRSLVSDALAIRKLATDEVCGSDEEATSEIPRQDET